MASAAVEPLQRFRAQARKMSTSARGLVTPFNLGYCVGRAGENISSPYETGSVADQNYLAGINAGGMQRSYDHQRKDAS